MFTKQQIFEQLKQMNAPQDKPVIVHTSLKAVGEVEGRAQGLLDVLIEYFTADGGLLIVPTHTWANFYELKKEITLDLNDLKTCVGTFPEIALADGRGVRTLNPTHSVTVFGNKEKVAQFIENEESMDTPTSPNGVYGKIFDWGGYALLIGVGQNKNTILHCVEEILDTPNRLSNDYAKMIIKLKDGALLHRKCRYMQAEGTDDVSQFFPKYEPAFRFYGAIADGFIGNAKTQLCSASIMKQVMSLVAKNSGGKELLTDHIPLEESWYK
jgi:aminoglycoside 3-N-acetyltransferase